MEPQLQNEVPPTLTYELDWASPAERQEILALMGELGRQTMNLRIMPESRLLRIRAPEDNNRIVGWAGLDAAYTPGMGEFFSLFVFPEYRSYLVGLILETARCAYVIKERPDVKRVLVRMEASSNTTLLRYRLGSELMVEAKRYEINQDTLALCKECELFGKTCKEQAFLWVDVSRFLERGYERLGHEVSIDTMPQTITLDAGRMRRAPRPIQEPPGTSAKKKLDLIP